MTRVTRLPLACSAAFPMVHPFTGRRTWSAQLVIWRDAHGHRHLPDRTPPSRLLLPGWWCLSFLFRPTPPLIAVLSPEERLRQCLLYFLLVLTRGSGPCGRHLADVCPTGMFVTFFSYKTCWLIENIVLRKSATRLAPLLRTPDDLWLVLRHVFLRRTPLLGLCGCLPGPTARSCGCGAVGRARPRGPFSPFRTSLRSLCGCLPSGRDRASPSLRLEGTWYHPFSMPFQPLIDVIVYRATTPCELLQNLSPFSACNLTGRRPASCRSG